MKKNVQLLATLSLFLAGMTSSRAQCNMTEMKSLEQNVKSNYALFKPTLLDTYKGDWFQLIEEEEKLTEDIKTSLVDFRREIVEYLTCAVQQEVRQIELNSRNSIGLDASNIQYLKQGSAGSEGLSSDIDVNLKGDGTEYAVAAINNKYQSMFNTSMEIGEMFDINFYAKDFVPSLSKSQKVKKGGQQFYEKEDWREHVLKEQDLINQDVLFQNLLAHVFMRKNMSESDFKNYINKSKALPSRLQNQITEEYLQYESRLKEAHNSKSGSSRMNAKIVMSDENRVYENMLVKAANKRLEYELAKSREALSTDRAYLDWKMAKTYSTLHANEAHCTAGAIVHVVANKQMLDDLYGKKGENKRKLKLTVHELYQSYTEQIGFAFHKLDHTVSAGDMVKLGKYIHRGYNALKHFYAESGLEPIYTETERLAATDWEGVKKNSKRDVNGKFTIKICKDKNAANDKLEALKVAELRSQLSVWDAAFRRYGLGISIGTLDDIPKMKSNLKKILTHMKTAVDYQYFGEYGVMYK